MFKIESYLTSIILNHLAKYVRNIRPQDAQVSLWEGEATFNNLDLRLDVLEQELKLPFELLSGHIHELNIRVPWTRITSEPIRITINTIEFVLKARHKEEAAAPGGSAGSSPQHDANGELVPIKQKQLQKKRQDSSEQQSAGAGSGIVNKIINNIVLNCHNIIFKYVEEDIVISMNVQLLSFASADESWQAAMVDVHPVKVVMRKLVQVSDLTICLDKRNAAGQIDVCQEPLLYRCTLEFRILRKYNANTVAINSSTRINIFTKSFDINISSLQFPMIMRLIRLSTDLMKKKKAAVTECSIEDADEEATTDTTTTSGGSYLSWAWNLLPSFNFEPFGADDESGVPEPPGHIMDVGVYVEELNFTLKNCEFYSDSIVGATKRLRYTPVVRISLGGIYYEMVSSKERHWMSMKMGLTSICIEPMGSCRGDEVYPNEFVETESYEYGYSFMDKSLFDEQCPPTAKSWGGTNYEEYSTHITDEYLLYRSPILAFDLVEYRQQLSNASDENILSLVVPPPPPPSGAQSSSNPCGTDLHVQYRLLSAGVTFRYNQEFVQVTKIIKAFIDSYDYPAYTAAGNKVGESTVGAAKHGNTAKQSAKNHVAKQPLSTDTNTAGGTAAGAGTVPKLHPPLMEDYDALMQHIPTCIFRFELKRINCELYAFNEPKTSTTDAAGAHKTPHGMSRNLKQSLPHFQVHLELLHGELTKPLQPDRLVHTTCQLPDKPRELLQACYQNYRVQLKNFHIALVRNATHNVTKLMCIPKAQLSYCRLLQPHHWPPDNVAEQKLDVTCEQLDLDFTRCELLHAMKLAKCLQKYQPLLLWQLTQQLKPSTALQQSTDACRLHAQLVKLRLVARCYRTYSIWNACVKSLHAELLKLRHHVVQRHELISTTPKLHNNYNKWLEWQAQFPRGKKHTDHIFDNAGGGIHLVMALWVEKYKVYVSAQLLEFLSCQEDVDLEMEKEHPLYPHAPSTAASSNAPAPPPATTTAASSVAATLPPQFVRHNSRHSLPSERNTRKISHPEETVHFSSERDEKLCTETTKHVQHTTEEAQQNRLLQLIKNLVLNLELAQGKLCIAEHFVRNEEQRLSNAYTQIRLPRIFILCSNAEQIQRSDMRHKIAMLSLNAKDTFNWTVTIGDIVFQNCAADGSCDDLLMPLHTTISMALTHRLDKAKEPKNGAPPLKVDKKPKSAKGVKLANESKAIASKKNERVADDILSDDSSDSLEPEQLSMHNSGESLAPEIPIMDNASHKLPVQQPTRVVDPQMDPQMCPQKGRHILTLTLHADTTPIHLFISTKKVKAMKPNIELLLSICKLLQSPASTSTKSNSRRAIQVITAAEENASIKEFLDLETNSESSKVSEKAPPAQFITSLFCQWTITKIILELEGNEELKNNKCLLELEDLLSTVDIHEDFTKYTAKVGQLNLRYLDMNDKGEWHENECLRIKMIAESSSAPFINVIVTCVGVKNFFKRIGAKRDKADKMPNHNINEIVIIMQAIEVILDLDRVAEFIGPMCLLCNNCRKKPKIDDKLKTKKGPMTSAMMPMIHLNSKGITLYLPVNSGKPCCTVAILKVENIKITPNLENPLQRNPIRADVYSKASQLGILSTPGSAVEDRQYELTCQYISAATGNWTQILTHMREQTNNFHRTNPAFEWNNQNRKPSLQFSELFNKFTFIITYAPCIVYNNVLICGQALEFNCASDFIASLTTYQINLISCMIIHLKLLNKTIETVCGAPAAPPPPPSQTRRMQSQPFLKKSRSLMNLLSSNSTMSSRSVSTLSRNSLEQKRINYETPHATSLFDSIDECNESLTLPLQTNDSGFQSVLSNSHCNKRLGSNERFSSLLSNNISSSSSSLLMPLAQFQPMTQPTTPVRHIPHSISLVAGIFLIKLFDVKHLGDVNKEHTTSCVPLLSLTLSQPSFMMTQNMYDRSTQISLFDLNINVARREVVKFPGADISSAEPKGVNLFPDTLLTTKQGQLSDGGIPPPLFSYKSQLTKQLLSEFQLELAKPLVLLISEENIEQLSRDCVIIYAAMLENPCFELRRTTPIVRASKLSLLRKKCFGADRIQLKIHRIDVKMLHLPEYQCRICCADVNVNLKFLTRPEKLIARASIGSLHMQTQLKIFVHPVGVRFAADLVTEPWHALPLISANAKFNVMQLDLGVRVLQQLQNAFEGYKRVSNYVSHEWQNFLLQLPPDNDRSSAATRATLIPIKCPTHCVGKKFKQRDEFYQDDLRAGAFQFVEMHSDTLLPLPYQIQIIKKNYGIICWRYPQPRKMTKIHIYPVPMAVPNPIQIRCRMEYYSETHECFMHYCDFWLSETVSKEIELPERDICANIWRVVILQSLISVNGECFDNSEEDEELQSITSMKIEDVLNGGERKESEFILHPKVLVGCMRVDTAFQSECVPKLQLLVSFNTFRIKFLNQPNENIELPRMLKKFKLTQNTQISQTFLVLNVERLNFYVALRTMKNYTLTCDFNVFVKCLDYGFLNLVYLMDKSNVQSFLQVNKKQRTTLANVVVDRVRFNMGPSILHTLISSKMHWQEFFETNRPRKRHSFITKFIIVNRTQSLMSFGQTGTTERIQLHPKECNLYSFRSDYFNQEISIFIVDDETRMTEASQPVPLRLKYDGEILLQNIRIGNKCLVLKSRKLSATQIYVLIKGQFELVSMVPHEFRLEIRHEGRQYDEKNLLEYSIEPKSRDTFFRKVYRSSNIVMRLKFPTGIGKGRSGDIPLKTNRNLPWLVKVPFHKNEFISFWVRIIREDISDLMSDKFHPQKLLITIWPIFEIYSTLTCAVNAEESSTLEQLTVAAEGGRQLLNVPATHLTEHTIKFDYNFPLGAKPQRDYMLSLKSINWNEFFWYDEQKWNIEYALHEMAKGQRSKWPVQDEEELRIKRLSYQGTKTSIVYKCAPTREFSCSLCLEVAPWGMFINATGITVRVRNHNHNEHMTIESNCIEMMFAITSAFVVEIGHGENWISSLPIYFKESSAEAVDKFYVAQENISSEIVILSTDQVLKLVLDFKIENERKIFILRSKYSVTNFTNTKLCVLPFTLDHKESSSRSEVKALDVRVCKKNLFPVKSTKNCIGITIDSFYDLHAHQAMRSSDTAFVSFVCFKICEESDISIPIPLTMQFTRKCFSVQNGNDSIALAVTLIEKAGIYYLNVFEDTTPALWLDNQTDLQLLVAQTSAAENSKVTSPTSDYEGKHFVWHQELPAYSKSYYTPPEMYANFPDVESTQCNLTIALKNDKLNKNIIKWSKPIRTDKTWEKFLHIPQHGDVKLSICDNHKIIRVSIYYFSQQMEFSVKDLRSRFLTPPPPATLDPTEDIDHSITSMHSCTSSTQLSAISAVPMPNCKHFSNDCDTKMQLKLRCFIKELNVSIYTDAKEQDYMKTEIFALYVDDFMLAFDDDNDQRQLQMHFSNLQIDNQLYSNGNYDFPVVLCAQDLYQRTVTNLPQAHYLDRMYDEWRKCIANSERVPMVRFIANFYDDEMQIRAMELNISPIRAYIEDAYLNDLLDALVELAPRNCVYHPSREFERLTLSAGEVLLPRDVAAQAICISEPFKLQSFRIQPLHILLSVHTSVRLYIALDHSPLSFGAYERQQILTVPLRFGQSLGMHYLSGAIFGAGWVVGSLEILGSPSGLARSFSHGLRDFVSMPVRGLFRGPWGFIVGVTQGSASLLRNVTAGTVNSVTKLASSVARNLDRLSLDSEHIQRTEALRRSRPQGFAQGLTQGATGLGISILGAVGGIARHTLEARTAVQVVTGMGKGLVGAFTKPLSGAAELVALAGQGMLHTVGFNAMPLQRAPSVSRNVAVDPSAYRIWKLLPGILASDQILFYNEVTLVVQDQLRKAYVFLTSAVFAVMEAHWDKLSFVYPTDKVEISVDRDDKTLIYVRITKENDDIEEDMSYTNQRIMNFLRSSFISHGSHGNALMTTDSLNDLLQAQSQGTADNTRANLDWAFYIGVDMGEFLIQYLKVVQTRQ